MEQNKKLAPRIETPQTPTPDSAIPKVLTPAEIQAAKKGTSSRIMRDVLITLAVFVALITGVVIYFAVSAAKSISTIPSSCTAREKRLQTSADGLKATLGKITIDGNSATTITARPDGDCLTGSGARATAKFNLSASDVSAANTKVIQNLESSTMPQDQAYTAGSSGDYTQVNFLSTTVKAHNGDKYKVNYYLQTPITCQDFGTHACQTDAVAIQTYDLMHKPISNVEFILTSMVN